MYHYKIKRITDGKYSAGGIEPHFSNEGKIWKSLGHLKLHLQQFKYLGPWPYNNCILVRLKYSPEEVILTLNSANSLDML